MISPRDSMLSAGLLACLNSGGPGYIPLIPRYMAAGARVRLAHWLAAFPLRSPETLQALMLVPAALEADVNAVDTEDDAGGGVSLFVRLLESKAVQRLAGPFPLLPCVTTLLRRGCHPGAPSRLPPLHALAANRWGREGSKYY